MTIIVGLRVPARALEIGRLLDDIEALDVTIEGAVRESDAGVALFGVEGDADGRFPAAVAEHSAVTDVEPLPSPVGADAYAVAFEELPDGFWETLDRFEASHRRATADGEVWDVEVALPDQDRFADFREACDRFDIPLTVARRFNPSRPDSGTWYGLTEPQREALVLARRRGYFEIPRRCTVADLAGELGISDQAMSERLRRAVGCLVGNTMMVMEDD